MTCASNQRSSWSVGRDRRYSRRQGSCVCNALCIAARTPAAFCDGKACGAIETLPSAQQSAGPWMSSSLVDQAISLDRRSHDHTPTCPASSAERNVSRPESGAARSEKRVSAASPLSCGSGTFTPCGGSFDLAAQVPRDGRHGRGSFAATAREFFVLVARVKLSPDASDWTALAVCPASAGASGKVRDAGGPPQQIYSLGVACCRMRSPIERRRLIMPTSRRRTCVLRSSRHATNANGCPLSTGAPLHFYKRLVFRRFRRGGGRGEDWCRRVQHRRPNRSRGHGVLERF